MSPETSWRLPTNHKSLSNPLLYSRTNCLQSVKIGQVPSPSEKTNWACKQQTANTSGTNLEIGNDFIWAEWESVTSDGGLLGGEMSPRHIGQPRQVTMVRLRQNYWSMTYGCGKLLLLLRYLNSTCVSQVVFIQNRHQRWNQRTLSRCYQWERSDKWGDIRSSSGVRATPRWKIYFRK